MLFLFCLVLHDIPGVLKGNDVAEKSIFFIQLPEKLLIFTCSETKTPVSFYAGCDLLSDIINNEFVNRFR
jgi:hypothetical protein